MNAKPEESDLLEPAEEQLDRTRLDHESPLWLVSQAPALNELVGLLRRYRHELDHPSNHARAMRFSRRMLADARQEFTEMIRRGERRLHLLCELLCSSLLKKYQLRALIIGETEETHERFTLALEITQKDLYASTDLDFGNHVIGRFRISDGEIWRKAILVSNVVEYEALEPNEYSVYRILSRIKAEEEICNKVADEIFEFDSLVLRDKQLRHLGRYVKDVFGVKIVVGNPDNAYKVQKALAGLEWPAETLLKAGLPADSAHERLRFVEVKNYLARRSRKHSGWTALKSVIHWGGRTFEIQIQPLENFLHEREVLTRESHSGFKATRERIRDEVAQRLPLFGFYRALLQWLFVTPNGSPPAHSGVALILEE